MLDHDDRRALVHQPVEDVQQRPDIQGMQADGGLIKDEHGVGLSLPHLAGKLEALGFTAGKTGRLLAQGQVPEAHLAEESEPSRDKGQVRAGRHRLVHAHRHQLGQGAGLRRLLRTLLFSFFLCHAQDLARLRRVAAAAAVRARDVDIRQELYVQADLPRPVAGRAAQGSGVVGEGAGLQPSLLRRGKPGVDLSQLIVDVGVGRHRGAHVDADRRSIDQFRPLYALRAHALDVGGELFALDHALQRGDQALQHHGRLAGAGNAGDHGEPPLREAHGKRMHGMDLPGLQADLPQREELLGRAFLPFKQGLSRREPGTDHRLRIRRDLLYCSFAEDPAALPAGLGAELDDPVREGEDLRVVIDEDDGVAVHDQVLHDARQSLDVGGMQADGGLVEDVENTGGAVSHRPGKLHALPLPGGEGRRGPVKGKIAEAQLNKAYRGIREGFADVDRHGAHRLRQRIGHALSPGQELIQGHCRGFIQGDPAKPRGPCRLGEPCAAAGRAGALLQEAFHPLHPLLVLDLGQGVLHGVDRVVVGKIHLSEGVGLLVVIEDVLFVGRSVENDVPLLLRQVAEGHIRAHAHGPGNILHQGPHQGLPGKHGPLVDGEGFIRHQQILVHSHGNACPVTFRAGAGAVEGKILRAGPVKMDAALGADDLLLRRHRHGGRRVVAVGAPVGAETGKHQAQAVEQLGRGAEGTADARHAGTLMEGEGRRNMQHLIRLCPGRLGHPAPGIGGERLQIAPGPLRVQHAEGQGGFPRAGDAGDADDLPQGNIHINILEIVYLRAAHPDAGRRDAFVIAHDVCSPFPSDCIFSCFLLR